MPPLSGDEIKQRAMAGLKEGLRTAAERVLEGAERNAPKTDTKDDPDPTTTLSRSGRIDVDQGGRSVTVIMDTEYAAKQESNEGFEHPSGGGAHFLEDALKDVVPHLDDIVASDVRARIRRPR